MSTMSVSTCTCIHAMPSGSRREGGALRRYAHLSTGNYNPRTAALYTDVGYLTADPDLTAEAESVFQQLASLGKTRPMRAQISAMRLL